jgi:FixJ family two-component response regulator
MPGMTGTDLVDAVRTARPKLPVLMVSGYAEIPAGARSGILRLAKPFDEKALATAIMRAVGDWPAASL